jgi:hypothetical protein
MRPLINRVKPDDGHLLGVQDELQAALGTWWWLRPCSVQIDVVKVRSGVWFVILTRRGEDEGVV